ncbi:hypothetical protein G6030_00245 [Dietzia sp. E1]|uniref:restriction endonuclease subunit S n=1 Tax=Dietzia sp. E1 TaxID=328361 RepID=UPI0015FA840A|nr:hypothetical protein [Dietzia sp. E1]
MKVEWVPFGDIASLRRTRVDVDATATYREIGIRSFGKGCFIKEPVSGIEIGEKKIFRIKPGDLLFSNVFAWEGAVAVSDERHEKLVGSHRFMTWECNSERASTKFLRDYFLSDRGRAELGRASPGSAGRNKTLSIKNLERLRVPLPSLDDQTRIAEHLTLLQPTPSSEPPRGLGLPDGNRVRVGDLVQPRIRTIPVSHEETYPMLGVKWYGEGAFVREVLPGTEISAANVRRIESGDLIYNRLFAWKQSFALAASDGFSSNEFPAFEVDASQVTPRVLLALLTTEDFTEQVNAASTGSTPTSRNRLKEERFLNLTVNLPPRSAQPAIERALFTLDKAKKLHSRRNELAAAVLPAARNEIFTAMR